MEMNLIQPLEKSDRPILIAGPCSAESEEQVMKTAEQLAIHNVPVDLFRAGIWKPRTRPNNFEGIGRMGLQWLKRVKAEFGFRVTTEVAKTEHVFDALKAGIDVLWLGARTTVNPFSVQEVADALKGADIPVFIKNPINPDLTLWIGAIERVYSAGITRIGVVHRGFSKFGHTIYRNVPQWQIPIELKRQFPDLMILCDASHICGNKEYLFEISQTALDLNYDGLMIETHIDPPNAWSDAEQQVTPFELKEQILNRLQVRTPDIEGAEFRENIEDLRSQIDVIDRELIQMLANRMQISDLIGKYKKKNNISVLQPARWNEILEKTMEQAKPLELSEEFVEKILKAIHQESINHQEKIMIGKDFKSRVS